MNSKVNLRAKVGNNIIYAILLVCYYWMWARRDWQDYYEVIQNLIFAFTIIFFILLTIRIARFGVDKKDEMAVQGLRRADAICLKVMIAAVIAIAFAGAVYIFDGIAAGYALVGTILLVTVIRFVVFCILDSRGIEFGSKDNNQGES